MVRVEWVGGEVEWVGGLADIPGYFEGLPRWGDACSVAPLLRCSVAPLLRCSGADWPMSWSPVVWSRLRRPTDRTDPSSRGLRGPQLSR